MQQNSFLRRDAIFSAGVDPRPAAAAGGLASAPAAEDQIRIFMAKASAYSWMHDRACEPGYKGLALPLRKSASLPPTPTPSPFPATDAFNSRNALFTTVLVTLVSYVSGGIALSTAGDPSTWLTVFTAVLTLFAGAVAGECEASWAHSWRIGGCMRCTEGHNRSCAPLPTHPLLVIIAHACFALTSLPYSTPHPTQPWPS